VSRLLIILGAILILLGVVWPLMRKVGLGHLPGDLIIRRGGFTLYFPITTCIIVSVLFSIIVWMLNR